MSFFLELCFTMHLLKLQTHLIQYLFFIKTKQNHETMFVETVTSTETTWRVTLIYDSAIIVFELINWEK